MVKTTWIKTATGDVIAGDWRIRGPLMARPMFWIYYKGSRYTPTGKFADAVHATTLAKAKALVAVLQSSRS